MKRSLAILVVLLLFHCKNNRIERPPQPENLISKDKMVEVIYDMSVMSAAKGLNRRIIENKGIYPEAFVYTKHNIDSLQFALSNQYYSYDIKVYEDIYQRVKEKLQSDKEHFESLIEANSTKTDSISKSRQIQRDSIIKAKSKELNLDL